MKIKLSDFEEIFIVYKQLENILAVNPLIYTLNCGMGICFLMITLIFVIHTLLSTQGFFIILESILNFTLDINIFFSLFFFFLVTVYVGLAIVKGTIVMTTSLRFLMPIPPFKINQTWTNTFLFTNNSLIFSLIGLIIFYMQYSP